MAGHFRVLIIGGTGQVGAAVVRAVAAERSCLEVVMVNRKATSLTADPRLRQVICDTAAAQFPVEVTKVSLGSRKQRKEQDSLFAGHGVERRNR